jgi:hypothetical protein
VLELAETRAELAQQGSPDPGQGSISLGSGPGEDHHGAGDLVYDDEWGLGIRIHVAAVARLQPAAASPVSCRSPVLDVGLETSGSGSRIDHEVFLLCGLLNDGRSWGTGNMKDNPRHLAEKIQFQGHWSCLTRDHVRRSRAGAQDRAEDRRADRVAAAGRASARTRTAGALALHAHCRSLIGSFRRCQCKPSTRYPRADKSCS